MPSIPDPSDDLKNYRTMEDIGEQLPVPACGLEEQISPTHSILLLRLSALGDSVRLLPAVEFLRRNNHRGEIGVAAEPPMEQLFENYPAIDRVHSLPLKSSLQSPGQLYGRIKRMRSRQYDWVFDCHGLLKSGLVSFFSAARRRIGPHRANSKEANYLFQQHNISKQPPALPRILFYIQLLRPFTGDFKLTRSRITPRDFNFTGIDSRVKSAGEKRPILIHPRSSHGRYGRAKEWGADNFSELTARLLKITDRDIFITWGPGERQTAEKIADNFPDRIGPAPETSTLLELAFLVDNAAALISVDTLTSHLADLQQTPLFVLYTGSSFHINAPLFTPYRAITTTGQDKSPDIDTVYNSCQELLKTVVS